MIKKLLLAIALVIATHLSMSAAYSIVVNRSDGSRDAFMLANKPVVTFDDTDLIVSYEGSTVAIPRADVSNIEFVDNMSGVAAPVADMDVIEIVDACTFRIGHSDPACVAVYDLAGRVAAGAVVASDGASAIVSLATCTPGIYIIVYNNKSFKTIRR